MTEVLLIEDEKDLADTVRQYLALESIHCDVAGDGVTGRNRAQSNGYDVILLDLNLPRLDGLQVCEQLRTFGVKTPVLMLTARDQLQDKLNGFEVGTDDFLVKPFELEELVVRIQALSRRGDRQTRLLQCEDLTMDLGRREATRAGQTVRLAPIGWRLLETLLRASPQAVSRATLERAVWGDDAPDSNSLKVHMHNLRKAVDGNHQDRLMQTLPGFGFAVRPLDDEK